MTQIYPLSCFFEKLILYSKHSPSITKKRKIKQDASKPWLSSGII